MSATPGVVAIAGGSLAGVRVAESLRSLGDARRIIVVSDEHELPYDRPPLSKQVLTGQLDRDRILLRTGDDLRGELDLDLRLGVRAEALDVSRRTLRTSDGDVAYDALVIATGARVRRLPMFDADPRVAYVRTLHDALSLRDRVQSGTRVVVIGAGFIGAEIAASCTQRGAHVTILEAAPIPLERQLGPEMGAACAAVHARNGVTLRTGVSVTGADAAGVQLANGEVFPADVIVVGIGVQPNTGWLEGSGIVLDDGVRCDATCRVFVTDDATGGATNTDTADGPTSSNRVRDDIVAIGDVARFDYRAAGEPHDVDPTVPLRIEHWTNAAEMAAHAAGTLLGERTEYRPVPYFWSDQYGAKIQFFGRSTGYDEVRVVDGDTDAGSWLALYRKGDRLIGALGVTKVRALIAYRALLLRGASWDDALEQAAKARRPA